MFRRCLLAIAGPALVLAAGCGPVVRTTWKVQAALARAELAWMPNRLDFTMHQPTHRVALAAFEVLKAELAEARIRDVELTRDGNYNTPEGKPPARGSVTIPDDYPAFWLEGLPGSPGPALVNCRLVTFSGKTKEGEKVEVEIRLEIAGSDHRTEGSVRVGGHGDVTKPRLLIDRITERVHNPSARPGSPEEAAALKAAFDPGPKGKVDVSGERGEIAIRME